MDKSIVLIGVNDDIAGVVASVVPVSREPTVPDDQARLAQLASAPAAVVASSQWREWTEKIPADVRPPTYVLVHERLLDPNEQMRFFADGAQGCAPAEDVEWLLEEIQRAFRFATQAVEEVALRIGECVKLEGEPTDSMMIAWGTGPSGDVFLELRSIQRRMQPLTSAGDHPFASVSAREWLELYAFLRFGSTLRKEEGEELFKRIRSKAKLKDENAFLEAFEKRFTTTSADLRPQTVLLLGETGTGKSIVAKKLHRELEGVTKIGDLPFHHVNCSSLGEMADVELFGAMRGAYTSLDQTNPGKIFSSLGGSLFLDEFGALRPETQAKLLLFVENGTATPMSWLGSPLRVPIMIIAATNEILPDLVATGRFRADLYHRFRDHRLTLPPVRATKSRDLKYLIDYLLQTRTINPDCRIEEVGEGAMKKLFQHDYPGNVRELQGVLTRAVERAIRRRSKGIGRDDVLFDPSPLPRQDSVVALVTREVNGIHQILLRWNPYWRRWFFPGGRLEAETYEQCLQRELREKLCLEPRDYNASPVPSPSPIRLIQYSSRDKKLKEYHFHPYNVIVRSERLSALDALSGLRWLPDRPFCEGADLSEDLSPTLAQFRDVLASLPIRGPEPTLKER